MYRDAAPPLAVALEAKLAPHGFKTVEAEGSLAARGVRKLWHRKTWNTNRGVVHADPGKVLLGEFVERMRYEAGPFLGSSCWSQLGLQVVLAIDAARVPTPEQLTTCVDAVNTQGILIQSVFAVDPSSGEWSQARTWGQFVTGKYQDAIAEGIAEVVAGRGR